MDKDTIKKEFVDIANKVLNKYNEMDVVEIRAEEVDCLYIAFCQL